MPVDHGADFQPPSRYKNGHYSTFIPYLFGKKPKVDYKRERIDTPDGDFLDLDYIRSGNKKLAVLCHGLEGSSRSGYVILFADHLKRQGWDVLAMNYRSCSGEMNRTLQMYNSGMTQDLHATIAHVEHDYEDIGLYGFSLGGNIVLKYGGEDTYVLSQKIRSIVAISTPLDLYNASIELLKWDSKLYQWNFLLSLSYKIFRKKLQYPKEIQLRKLLKCSTLYKFDEHYTAPMFGYKDAADYYNQNASIQWLDKIKIPTFILNAKDDPFLGPKCYPVNMVAKLENVHLSVPAHGGHVGFAYGRNDRSWMIDKVDAFVKTQLEKLIS